MGPTTNRTYSSFSSRYGDDSSDASSEVCCDAVKRRRERHQPSQITIEKGGNVDTFIMTLFCLVFAAFTTVILVGDALFLPDDRLEWCRAAVLQEQGILVEKEYKNVDAITDPCYYQRTLYLLGFSPFECDFGRRMLCSVILGAAIGWERKAADRPAGIRTMSLVSLGSATFTMGGQFAFRSSTMGWDAARVSAAIPSGVGFLGSALIWKEATGGKGDQQRNHVHGIATAASVWLSASIGIGVGGALYVMSIWTVVLVLFVLRLVPQLILDEGPQPDINPLADVQDKTSLELVVEENEEEDELFFPLTESKLALFDEVAKLADAETALDGSLEKSTPQSSLRRRVSKSLRTSMRRSQRQQAPSFHGD